MKRLFWVLVALLAAQTAYAQPSPVPSYTTIQNSGTPLTARRIANFSGALSASDDAPNFRTNIIIASGGVTNAMLANSSVTLNTTSPIGGGGSLSLGGSLTLTCSSCLTGTPTATGDIMYSTSGGQAMTPLATVAAGSYLRSNGTAAAPLWSTLKLPNAATTGDILYSTSTNTIGNLADVAIGSVLVSGGIGAVPSWSTSLPSGVLPNVGTPGTYNLATNDSITTDAQGRVTAISTVTRTLTGGTGINTIGTLAADRTISIDQSFSPTWTGSHVFTLSPTIGNGSGAAKTLLFNNGSGTGTLSWNPSTNRTLTLPDATDTLVGRATTDTLTNKTISGSNNTLTNIANGSLVNSSVTVNTTSPVGGGGTVSLGGALTLTCTSCLTGTPTATGDIMYSTSGGQALSPLADVAAGSYLRSGGVAAAPVWSTLTLPNAATTGDLLAATGTNAVGRITAVAINQVLLSQGTTTLPAWGTVPNAALTNSSITVNTTSPVGGGTTVSLGGSVTLTCSTCVTGTLSNTRIPVANGAQSLQDSNFTASANALDIAAAGLLTLGGTTATSIGIGGSNLTSGLTIGVGSGQNINFQWSATTGLSLQSNGALLQYARGGTRTLNIATEIADTTGDTLAVTAGGGGAASATGGGAGGQLSALGGQGGTATTGLAAGAGGQATMGGGVGGTGAASGQGPGAGGLAIWRGGTGGTVTGGFGGGNGGNAAVRGGLATGTGTNGNVLIGDANTNAVNISGFAGALTLTPGLTSTWDSKDGTIKAATIDTTTGVALSIGGTTALNINIGRSGQNVLFPGGNLRAATPGTGVAAVPMLFGLANGAAASGATPATAGGTTTTQGGQGGAASTTGGGTAGTGGVTTVIGGKGGDGAASTNGPGNGGGVNITGGAGGTQNGVGSATGGNIVVNAGAGSGGGANGSISIGASNTSSVAVGASAITTTLAGNNVIADTKTLTTSYNGNTGTNTWLTQQNSTAATNTQPQWAPGQESTGHGWTYVPGSQSNAGQISRSGSTVTVNTVAAHGLTNGQSIFLYPGEVNFSTGVKGPITVTGSSSFTYSEAGSAVSSASGENIFDETGVDQTTKGLQLLRINNGKKFSVTGSDQGMSSPELVYQRSSYPNNGSYKEWFKLSALDPQAAYSGYNGPGVTLQTPQADTVTPGSYLKLAPSTVALLADNGMGFTTFNSPGTPGTGGLISWFGTHILSAGGYGATSLMGAGYGVPGAPFYDSFMVRGDFSNIASGDIATPRWNDGAISPSVASWFSPNLGLSGGPYGYYALGGNTRFAALAAPTSVTVTPTGGAATAYTYVVVAVDRNGYTTLSTTGSTASGPTTLGASNFNTVSWPAVSGAAYYDIYATSVSQANWLGQTTTTSFKHTGVAKYGTTNMAAPSMVTANWSAQGGGSGVSTTYAVYAVDADGRVIASGTASASFGAAPSLSNYWLIDWTPVGGAASYILARTDLSHPIVVVGQQGVEQATGAGKTFAKSGTSTVTVTDASGHGLKVGDTFNITASGNTTNFPNTSNVTVATVTDATHFTYTDGVGTSCTCSTTATYTGPFITTSSFFDYGYPTRLIGSATRNTTADVLAEGQVTLKNSSATNNAAMLKAQDSAGTTRYGIDPMGFPSLGARVEWRENWLMNQTINASGTNVQFTGGSWQYNTTANTGVGFTNTSGFATGSPLGSGLTINSGTANTNSTRVNSVPAVVQTREITNLYHVTEFPAVLGSIGNNNITFIAGVANAAVASTSGVSTHPGGWWFRRASGDNNWQCVTDDGTNTTTIDSGTTGQATTNVALMRMEYYGSGTPLGTRTVKFYINGTLVCTSTTNVYNGQSPLTGGQVNAQFFAGATGVATNTSLGIGPLLSTHNIFASPTVN